ncbi:L-type lectin-domain containing receptor kinase SIT2-like [Populus alba]|uniref:non-specific serine/threonine protein kinase n=1 Tax=Populus alba x Populus x berolinensis TaxID=444605 RepID=A0AAD6QBX6_9ROSI|nr:L-type lectin-domain containing receptor kinase SIT2-like [Populus alba]KAJ6984473.1 L-type lectin-domain containing receptor kinase SIT2-like [Populus alba x Populus x berolinensis]
MVIASFKSLHFLLGLFVSLKLSAFAQEENHFIYHGFTGANLLLGENAKIHPNGLLELTNTSKHQIGRAFFPFTFQFNTSLFNNSRSLSFSTQFAFAMVPELPTLGGQGMAFTISPSVDFTGAMAAQYFGILNSTSNGLPSNHLLAVELDAFQSLDLKDINDNHVGIDVNSLISIESAPVTYFSDEEKENKSLTLISGHVMHGWIDYDEAEKLLNVTVAPVTRTKPTLPLLSTPLDLSSVMLDSMYVGFSSSTGAVASSHYILGWSFNRGGQAQSLDVSKLPTLPTRRKSTKKPHLRIMVPAITAIILLVAISGDVCIIRRKKYEELREDWEQEYGPQRFSYKDLYKATKGFTDSELLGCGGFGKVYRGVLPSSSMQVAIKKVSHDSRQGTKEFVAEIVSMGRLRHRNLVQLFGYCRRKGELLLVYDYMPNGSLDKLLFRNDTPSLNWARRYQIIRGVASALLYLHEEWEQVVLHRDVKASNVLLDADLNGRLGDFGLAKFHDHGSTPQTTKVVGTVGYLAPEITRTGKSTTCSDVFSFGTFMLEVTCGRKPVESERPPEEVVLVDWVLECWNRGAILGTVDPRFEGNHVEEEMELVLKLGLLCTHRTPAARPSMRQAVQYLDGNATLPDLPLHGAGIGLVPVSNEASREHVLTIPISSGEISSNSLSDSESILSGR